MKLIYANITSAFGFVLSIADANAILTGCVLLTAFILNIKNIIKKDKDKK